MMKHCVAALLLAGCQAEQPTGSSAAAPSGPPPAGAIVSETGYWTVLSMPPSPAPIIEKPRPQTEMTYYAQVAGVSNEEAARRMAEQQKLQPEMVRLMETLRARENGNFLDAELVHRPDWTFLFYFRRDPEATLARHTNNPRFQARQGGAYTDEELQAVTRPWVDRLQAERLFTGYGVNTRLGRLDMDMVVSEAEFRRIASAKGWGPVPPTIAMKFAPEPAGPAMAEDAEAGVRIFPQNDRNLGIINQAAIWGRITLRDGCFFVDDGGRTGLTQRLAYFPREVGLYRDAQGFLALRNRYPYGDRGPHLGRIGERFMWGGPIGVSEDLPMVKELRARCGNAPLVALSVPDAEPILYARYPHLREGPINPPPPAPPPPPKR